MSFGYFSCRHPRLGQLGADHLVVVEGDPPVGLEAAGPRLADVVQQRGEPQHQVGPVGLQVDGLLQHGQRVLVDVLVPVVLVALQPQRRQLGQHPVGQTGVDQQPQSLARVVGQQQLVQLVADPLGGDDRDPVRHRRHRRHDLRRHLEVELGGEPGRAHHPQRVVGERRLRGARGAQHPAGQVGQAAVRVDEVGTGQRHRHRVHREVPADQVLLDGVAVGDLRLARGAVVRLGAVGGDLDLEARSVASALRQPTVPKAIPDLPDRVRPGPQTSFSTCSGRASVVKSRSLPSRPSRASRTEPPTRASWNPASWKRRPSSSATGSTADEPGAGGGV